MSCFSYNNTFFVCVCDVMLSDSKALYSRQRWQLLSPRQHIFSVITLQMVHHSAKCQGCTALRATLYFINE